MGSMVFRNPQALSSALAAFGTLQPRALGFLNTVDPLDTVSNCYIQNDLRCKRSRFMYTYILLLCIYMNNYMHVHVCTLVGSCLATGILKAHISKLKW